MLHDRTIVLRGRLSPTEDGAALLDPDGMEILLDVAGPLPEGVADTCIELFTEPEKTALCPYES